MTGLVGRIFREFSITIIVSIFASGIVSLTLDAADVLAAAGQARAKARRRRGWSGWSAASSTAC